MQANQIFSSHAFLSHLPLCCMQFKEERLSASTLVRQGPRCKFSYLPCRTVWDEVLKVREHLLKEGADTAAADCMLMHLEI
eukprot:scaffold289363_cov17-Tisochrysis_lutea.AAC.2